MLAHGNLIDVLLVIRKTGDSSMFQPGIEDLHDTCARGVRTSDPESASATADMSKGLLALDASNDTHLVDVYNGCLTDDRASVLTLISDDKLVCVVVEYCRSRSQRPVMVYVIRVRDPITTGSVHIEVPRAMTSKGDRLMFSTGSYVVSTNPASARFLVKEPPI